MIRSFGAFHIVRSRYCSTQELQKVFGCQGRGIYERYGSSSKTTNTQPHNDTFEESQANETKRLGFNKISVLPSILEYIDSIGVGIPPRKTSRRSLDQTGFGLGLSRNSRGGSKRSARTTKELSWKPPPPFGDESFRVSVVGSIGIEHMQIIANETRRNNSENRKVDTCHKRLLEDSEYFVEFPPNKSLSPEIALAGRSNVGKSTLLNALLYGNRYIPVVQQARRNGRRRASNHLKVPKGVKASMSNRPGETRHITFYQLQTVHEKVMDSNAKISKNHDKNRACIHTHRLRLIDLPGYGFSYASEEDSLKLSKLMTEYLLHRDKSVLKRLLILIDARHGMKKADFDFLTMLQEQQWKYNNASAGISKQRHESWERKTARIPPIQLVLTKCDLVTQSDLARRVIHVREQLSDCFVREPSRLPVMLVSARPDVVYKNVIGELAKGGVLHLQKELAALTKQSTKR